MDLKTWFNHDKYPPLNFGFFAIPGPFLPILLVNLLIALKHLLRTSTISIGPTSPASEKIPHAEAKLFRDGRTPIQTDRNRGLHYHPLLLQFICMYFGPLPMACLVAFNSSCLGWRYILYDLPARTPSAVGDGAIPAALVYLVFWLFWPLRMRQGTARTGQRELREAMRRAAQGEGTWFGLVGEMARVEMRVAMEVAACVMALELALYFGAKVWFGVS